MYLTTCLTKLNGFNCNFVSFYNVPLVHVFTFINAQRNAAKKMKHLLLLTIVATTFFTNVQGKGNGKKGTAAEDSTEIHWMTLDEVQVAMKKQQKKVFIDVYTDWCGWCKVMDRKTFSNKEVIKYMNQNFYAVKLDAERKDSVMFLGRMYGFEPGQRANQLAVELLGGRMSYPTSVILEEGFRNPAPIPGYLDVATIEKILKYLGENIYKSKQFPEYEKEFVASWTTQTEGKQ